MRGIAISRLLLALALVWTSILSIPAAPTLGQGAPDDAARFAEVLAERDALPRLDAPSSGDLVQQDGDPLLLARTTETDVVDFVATATFYAPSDLGLFDIYDMGFVFRDGDQFVVDSLGFWLYIREGEGVVLDGNAPSFFDLTDGGTVTIDLVVDGDRALFGFGGVFVDAFDVAPGPGSFVAIDTGLVPEFRIPDTVVPFTDFAVWALPDAGETPDTAPEVEPTATAEATAAPPDTAATTSEITPEASERFAALLAEQDAVTPLAGPFNALLKEEEGRPGLSWAGVAVDDFHARAVVTVPDDPSMLIPWSAGFAFGASPAGEPRVAISSWADWAFAVGGGEPAASGGLARLVMAPGETNTLDLMVQGDAAWLGLNGELVAAFGLPAERTAGDVGLGAGLYFDELVAGRITPFQEFVVLPLPPDALTMAATGAPATADEERFLTLLAEMGTVAPAAGPFAGRLVEATAGTAPTTPGGVAFADFAASAEVVNPADPAAGTWDSGFQFRSEGDVTNRIMVDSLGDVYASLAGQTPVLVTRAANYDAGPDNTNTLQLFVEGERALFGVNGLFVAAIDVPAATAPGDVLLGVAFFNEDFVAGRVTDYREFRLWEIG